MLFKINSMTARDFKGKHLEINVLIMLTRKKEEVKI
jgi:hypothetical protein